MKKHSKKTMGIILSLVIVLAIINFMNTLLVFRMTSQQIDESGEYQLENISGELEGTIDQAKLLTIRLGVTALNKLEDRQALEEYITDTKEELVKETGGQCYNVYIAGEDWDIIPDLVKPENFDATQRQWYRGAIAGDGEPYVTAPYIDAWTGNICYSVAVELGDQKTVLGIDYTLDNIQEYIAQMYETGSQDALIITEEGIIAGYKDKTKVGTKINDTMPQYTAIFAMVKSADGMVRSKVQARFSQDKLFATKTASGWYLIVRENNWELYRSSYMQLAFTMILSLALFSIIITLYLISRKNQKKAENALAAKEEFLEKISADLRQPLRVIMQDSVCEASKVGIDDKEKFDKIHQAGKQLSEMIEQIISYSNIVKVEKKSTRRHKDPVLQKRRSVHFRKAILFVLVIIMAISLYANISASYRGGNISMQSEVNNYEDQLTGWINTQKSILDMFCSVLSTNPQILSDYEKAVEFLNEITVQYPEISVSYMTNPRKEHTVIMNNGWQPDENWHVEERQWYIDTIESAEGFNISAPYYDEQTGLYCVTMSERVYDARTGEFLGNFGIDFYMDKLVDILGASYSEEGYAFLADADGEIINHPYGTYQMSEKSVVNIDELGYSKLNQDGRTTMLIKDYDGRWKILIARKNKMTNFTIYVVSNVWSIYGNVILYALTCLIMFVVCIAVVYQIVTNLLHWQDEVHQNLQESADLAIAAGKAKSQFLAQMSHEIRTPINAVLGMNEMILRESTDVDIREYALNIQSAGRTLLTLINSILDFSKIEDGKMEIIPVNYDTSSMIHDLVNTVSERAARKDLEFIVKVDETLPARMYGDDVRIRQVVSNLLTNAVKYTEKGTVTLEIRGNRVDKENIELFVCVKDTGIGIKEEDREKLFESFQRLEEKRNRNIEGTGLGISIVTKLLQMMDSQLQVDSVYGVGSEFYFTLRQGIITEEPIGNYEERLALSIQREEEEILYVTGAKILVVDDNEMNIKVARSLMKRNGIQPDIAFSGMEAIRLVQQKNYDVIFLDHMMPQLDGVETLERMRNENLLEANTVVVALTANAIVGAKESYLSQGFDDYLSKPIEPKQMEKCLAKYLPQEMVSYKKIAATSDVDTVQEVLSKEEVSEDAFTMEELLDIRSKCPQLNVIGALEYSMDSREFYLSCLRDYKEDEKATELQQYFEAEDWENYAIKVHALKSTSKMIGATSLSEHALELEVAAGQKNASLIKEKHSGLLQEYEKLLQNIGEVLF